MGPKTAAALKAFQLQKLTDSGQLDDQTREKLEFPADAASAPGIGERGVAATFSMRSAESSHTGHVAPAPILTRNVAAVAQLEAADRARQTSAERFSDIIARVAGRLVRSVGRLERRVRARLVYPIDPFPFSFLTLVVSLEAIFLSIFVLISQNNLTRLSEQRAHLDLQINLLAEQEDSPRSGTPSYTVIRSSSATVF